MASQKDSLSREDIIKWGKNVLIFFTPSLIVFLQAINNGVPVSLAFYALPGGIIASLLDLLIKFKAGSDQAKEVTSDGTTSA